MEDIKREYYFKESEEFFKDYKVEKDVNDKDEINMENPNWISQR